MSGLKPINVERIRRISTLILLALFAWMFFYFPPDLYEIQIQNYKDLYEVKLRQGIVDQQTSLQQYIEQEMQGPYWHSSPITREVLDLKEAESAEFLRRIAANNDAETADSFIAAHQGNGFTSSDSYFFRSKELPPGLLSEIVSKKADYLSVQDNNGETRYFDYHAVTSASDIAVFDAPNTIKHPIRTYAYLLIVLALFAYLLIPKPSIPESAAVYTRLNAVYLPDVLGVFLWTGGWMFFFLPDDSAPVIVPYLFLLFFGLFGLIIMWSATKYASSWYRFKDGSFQWSGSSGIQSIALADVVSVKPYKRQLPRWIAPLIVLFGRGQPGATGVGILSGTSAPEIGMEITTNSGERIKVMANYLEADDEFTEKFQELERNLNG